MKKIKYATWTLGVILFLKIVGINFLENYVILKLGAEKGINAESVLIALAFTFLLYYLMERGK